MSQLQIDYDLEATDITDPNPVSMIMLVNHLHEILPKYNPAMNNQSEVVFEAGLGQTQTKDIELFNKYKRTLQYRLKALGWLSFSIRTSQIMNFDRVRFDWVFCGSMLHQTVEHKLYIV